MGNEQSSSKQQKLKIERALKTGIISLNNRKLKEFPKSILGIDNVKHLDVSNNKLEIM